MNNVTSTIAIQGEIQAVFDLLTTTRFWTRWHPATTGVGGVTERPFQLGDTVRERAQIGSRVHEGNWTVSEHARPHQAQLRMPPAPHDPRLVITYSLSKEGAMTMLTRSLDYYPEDFAANTPDPTQLQSLMVHQSELALDRLKALVEEILQAETELTIAA
jgi:hypothetical protein